MEVWPEAEVIVVDGGSRDETVVLARAAGARVIESFPGRGHQMQVGAAAATGEWWLFLHADTLLPLDGDRVLEAFVVTGRDRVATFRLHFDDPHWFLAACAWFTRFDTVWTRFGDQGIVVHRELYEKLGGMPEWPLFEDVEFLRQARRLAPVVSLPAAVTTSARRFRQHGLLRQQWINGRLLAKFLRGGSPWALARDYGLSAKIISPPNHESALP